MRCAYGHRPEPADVLRSCCWNSGTAGTITSGHRSSRPALRLGGWQRQAWCSRGLLPPLPLRRAAAPLCVDPGRTRASCGLSERPVTPELHTARGQESPRQRSMEDVSPGEKPEEGRLKDSPCVVASELATARCHKHFPCKQDHRMAWVEKAHSAHPVPSPCYMQGCQPANQTAQSHIQPGLECLQGWGNTTSLGNLFQCVTTPCVKNFLLISNLNLSCLSL